jgi:hypothetical protein
MATIEAVSGVGEKAPAAFLVTVGERRILFDLGEGPTPGQRPDLLKLSPVDSICLTHSHSDHTGALDLHERLGTPLVYATERTWQGMPSRLPPKRFRRKLPEFGSTLVCGVPILTGRSGHAPGGVWLHVGVGDGLTYTGDWSGESQLFPFDPPPNAGVLVTDASYGDRDTGIEEQIERLVGALGEGAVLPVPDNGRGPEMALRLFHRGLRPRLCPVLVCEVERLMSREGDSLKPESRSIFRRVIEDSQVEGAYDENEVIIAVDATAEHGLSSELAMHQTPTFRFIFTGHVAPGTHGRRMVEDGAGQLMDWNAHPHLSDNIALARATGATRVVPAFCPPEELTRFDRELDGRMTLEPRIVF